MNLEYSLEQDGVTHSVSIHKDGESYFLIFKEDGAKKISLTLNKSMYLCLVNCAIDITDFNQLQK